MTLSHKKLGSSSGAGCNSRPVVRVHEPIDDRIGRIGEIPVPTV